MTSLYGSENIFRYMKASRIRWAGHVVRSDDHRLLKTVFFERIDDKRSIGKPSSGHWKHITMGDGRAIIDAAKSFPQL